MVHGQVARIDPFQNHDPRVLPQLPGELSLADVHGDDTVRSMLQQAVGESPVLAPTSSA